MLATNFSYGIEKDEEKLKANDHDHTKWTNPLESRLPYAPSMKFFCVYGHGKPTEVSCFSEKVGRLIHDSLPPLALVLVRMVDVINKLSLPDIHYTGTLVDNMNTKALLRTPSSPRVKASRNAQSQGPL